MATDANNKNRKNDISQLPLVPESVLKRRHDLDDMARRRAAERAALGLGKNAKASKGNSGAGKKDGGTRTLYVKKPETILASARSRRNHMIRYKRVMKKGMQKRAKNAPDFATKRLEDDADDDEQEQEEREETSSSTPAVVKKYQANSVGAKMVLAIRIRDDLGAPRPVKKILREFGLGRVHSGVFLRYHDENRKRLHLVEPWVVYGPPAASLVQDLVERRGHGGRQMRVIDSNETKDAEKGTQASDSKDRRRSKGSSGEQDLGERIPLSDNTVIERALGASCNVVCKEDLVHEICQVGPHFDDVTAWLWPFVLEDAKSHFQRKTLKVKDGKDEYGDRGEFITEYVQEVL
jgi:large subunit ribosomal protein L7e